MTRRVKSSSFGGLEGVAKQEDDGYTWVEFYEGRVGHWLPNEDLEEVEGSNDD